MDEETGFDRLDRASPALQWASPALPGRSHTFREVAVVGGGISGLTAAWHLKKAGIDVCLLESRSIVGGCTRTERRDGFLLEKGPFNVIVRAPAFEALLDDVSDDVSVITAGKAARIRYIYRHGRLHAVPTNPIALATTRLLSVGARRRLLSGLVWSPRAGPSEETIEQAVVRRFGQEVADTIVSAAISGILAGDTRRLSLRACFPSVARIDSQARSLIGYGLRSAFVSKGARKDSRTSRTGDSRTGRNRKNTPAQSSGNVTRRWRGLVSIDGGLGALSSALGRRLGSDLFSGCPVQKVHTVKGGYELTYRSGNGDTRSVRCRRLVMAAPALEAGRLLKPTVPDMAAIIASIDNASLVVVDLGYRRGGIGHPLEGFGFLVPHNEPDFPLMGVLWADSIFPHHAPPDHRLIRVFIGGAGDPDAVTRTDDELLGTAADALRDLLWLRGEPVLVDICRHVAAIPQYHLGHCEKIERLRAAVAAQPGLYLIGNYLEGVSLNDCIRLAADVADEVAQATHGL